MKQGGRTESPFPGPCYLSPKHTVSSSHRSKGKAGKSIQSVFLLPERTIHLCLGGNGRIMIKSSAGLTEPDYAAQFPLSLLQRSCPFSISRLPGTL